MNKLADNKDESTISFKLAVTEESQIKETVKQGTQYLSMGSSVCDLPKNSEEYAPQKKMSCRALLRRHAFLSVCRK